MSLNLFRMPSQKKSDGRPGIIVTLYNQNEKVEFGQTEEPCTAESICIECAKILNIGPLAFPLFALYDTVTKNWLMPNQQLVGKSKSKTELSFRIRFHPHPLRLKELSRHSRSAFMYYFEQCRHDFRNDFLRIEGDDSQRKALGIAIIDGVCYGKVNDLDIAGLKSASMDFIPASIKCSFSNLFEKKRLKNNYYKKLEETVKDNENSPLLEMQKLYIDSLFKQTNRFSEERFTLVKTPGTEQPDEVLVRPHSLANHSDKPGIYFITDSKRTFFCCLDELTSIESRNNTLLQLNRSEGIPMFIQLQSKEDACSFLALLDGYYRLMKDIKHHVCDDISSPLLSTLHSIRCFCPVQEKWAVARIMGIRDEQKKQLYNYLLQQDPSSWNYYKIVLCSGTSCSYRIVEKDSRYQLELHHDSPEPSFQSIPELLKYYEKGNNPEVPLKNRIPPNRQDDPSLYLCQEDISKMPTKAIVSKKAATLVPPMKLQEPPIGQGTYTNVHLARRENDDSIQMVAVKQLKPDALGCLEGLAEAVQCLSNWNHPTIVNLYCTCLSPMQAIMEQAEYGSLEKYLHHSHPDLKVEHLVYAGEQIAHALNYLQEYRSVPDVHGNIRLRNILLFRHGKRDIEVKLGDPGMVHLAKNLPLEHDINRERMPWIAPECYQDLKSITMYSDRFAYGITLWEMFMCGARPWGKNPVEDIQKFVLKEEHLEKPEQCPSEIYEIMLSCWSLEPEVRMNPPKIIRDIRSVAFKAGTGQYMSNPIHHYMLADQRDTGLGDTNAELLDQKVREPEGPLVVNILEPGRIPPREIPHRQHSSLLNSSLEPKSKKTSNGRKSGIRQLPDTPVDNIKTDRITLFELDKPLGEGHYGQVFKAIYNVGPREGIRIVAAKRLRSEMYAKHKQEFDDELKMMQKLNHKNIVSLIGRMIPPKETEMYIIMEFVENGSLSSYLRKRERENKQPSITDLTQFAREICEGMVYLSQNKIVHRDLAARNVLVTKDGPHMKISDFGLSKVLDPDRDYYVCSTEKALPLKWCAPEVIEFTYRRITEKSDVWSFAVTVWEIYTHGKLPNICDDKNLLQALKSGERLCQPERCPPDMYALMRKCWELKADDRYHFWEAEEKIRQIEKTLVMT